MRPQFLGGAGLHQIFLSPNLQDFRRRAMVKSAVDFAASANAAAFHIGDFVSAKRNGLAAISVLLQHLSGRKGLAGLEAIIWTFLQQQNVSARFGQEAGGYRAARPGADHRDFTCDFTRRVGHHPGHGHFPRRMRMWHRIRTHVCRRPAVERERCQAFVITNQIARKTQFRATPGGHLPVASRR